MQASNPTPWGVAMAGGLGLLIGVERERSSGGNSEGAGIRTFTVIGLTGGLAAWAGTIPLLVSGLGVVSMAVASYRHTAANDPGSTSEFAMLLTWLLGVTAMHSTVLAAAAGIGAVLLLASKSRIHYFATRQLTRRELHDALLLVAVAFVVLPLLPARAVDPWGAINPQRLGFLIVAMMVVSSAGYLALRFLGPRLGLALTALAGGLVSSTATIAAMASKARDDPANASAFAGAGLLSNIGTLAQIGVVVALLCPALLTPLAVPLLASCVTTLVVAVMSGWRAMRSLPHGALSPGARPFQPRHVLAFVGLMALLMLVGAFARNWLGQGALAWISAVSGLADVHAAIAAAAQLTAGHQVDAEEALQAMAAALASNSVLKCTLAIARGGRSYASWVIAGIVAMVATFGGSLMLVLSTA
ncbi:hypothetical protein AB839_03160 [Stenotrophomonas sp. DDT-1]|nr:hypothetical protein AB839_03160 [Stenotrophomonas sp. DDT-1]